MAAVTQLHHQDTKSYSQLLVGLATLALRPMNRLVAPRATAAAEKMLVAEEAEAAEAALATEDPEKVPEVAKIPVVGASTTLPAVADEDDTPAAIFEPLHAALQALSSAVGKVAPVVVKPAPSTSSWSVATVTGATPAEQNLSKSLLELTEYIEAESFASTSAAYRSYGTPVAGTNRSHTALNDAVASFKTEVRSLKGTSAPLLARPGISRRTVLTLHLIPGTLLNRRNFNQPRAEVAG